MTRHVPFPDGISEVVDEPRRTFAEQVAEATDRELAEMIVGRSTEYMYSSNVRRTLEIGAEIAAIKYELSRRSRGSGG